MDKPSKKMFEIYRYIESYSTKGISPTVREIAAAVHLKSTSSVHRYLGLLEEQGHITKSGGQNRSIIVNRSHAIMVPVLGNVAAGVPITITDYIDEYVPFIASNGSSSDYFATRVKGESMRNAGIFTDDIIIVRATPVAENGSIVVAVIDDESTVKRYYKENGHFRLQPENDELDPIILDEVTIAGVVVSVIRNFE